jgi:peptidoglycan/xylan/chitin deacetylase (PgdA/CDA1 family)
MSWRKAGIAALHLLGGTWLLRTLTGRRRAVVLCYHHVVQDGPPARTVDSWSIPLGDFIWQLDYLKRHCSVISLSQFLDCLRGRQKFPPRSVVLTFDDGYRSFGELVLPALQERGLPASLFVITQYLEAATGNAARADSGWCLSPSEIASLAQHPLITIGSHTRSHPDLARLSTEQAAREISDSFKTLHSFLGLAPLGLAYPYGSYRKEYAELVESSGYECGLTVRTGTNGICDGRFELRRNMVLGTDSRAMFRARLSRLHDLVNWLRHSTRCTRH